MSIRPVVSPQHGDKNDEKSSSLMSRLMISPQRWRLDWWLDSDNGYIQLWAAYSTDVPCIDCCETRSHGHLVVLADVIDEKCGSSTPFTPTPFSSSSSPFSSTGMSSSSPFSSTGMSSSSPFSSSLFPTTPPGCICCETRTHGHVIIIAE
ncbi:uncharacterized protein LOC123550683 [Mercenaria mercenaria]|uniref:uncharacterized protein LOC123550683 n=1 Tax=Mercenaria mercenaria TaxID=6596 RepID=UPI00234FB3C7|nr:uncharacterized protein LOC123550683 [Mercenaria mercenaria]